MLAVALALLAASRPVVGGLPTAAEPIVVISGSGVVDVAARDSAGAPYRGVVRSAVCRASVGGFRIKTPIELLPIPGAPIQTTVGLVDRDRRGASADGDGYVGGGRTGGGIGRSFDGRAGVAAERSAGRGAG